MFQLPKSIGFGFKLIYKNMDYTKEFLLSVAVIFVSSGVAIIKSDILTGSILLLVGVAVFFARGFYKKYFGDK